VNCEWILERLRFGWLAHRRWAALLSGIMMVTARFFPTSSLRVLVYGLGVVFLLLTVIDVAQDFLDRDYPKRPNNRIKAKPAAPEIFFAAMLAFIYSFFIIAGMNLFFLPSAVILFFVMPAIFLICCLVAWHNVTLWYDEGADYEEALKEANTRQAKTISSAV
jgi:amino acid transporter